MNKAQEIAAKLQAVIGDGNEKVESLQAKAENLKVKAEEIQKKAWAIRRNVDEEKERFLQAVSIEEAISCISENQPEVIEIREQEKRGRFFIVRPYGLKEYGVLFYKNHKNNTHWQVSFNCDGFISGHYSVPCACCHIELHGYDRPEWSKEEIEEWSMPLRAKLRESIVGTCEKHGIKTLFMRHAEDWKIRFEDESIRAAELDRYEEMISQRYGEHVLSKSFGFIHAITERD